MHIKLWVLVFCLIITAWYPFHIESANAGDGTIRRIGRGSALCVEWQPNTDVVAVGGSAGIWLYTSQLEDIAFLEFSGACPEWSPDGRYLMAVKQFVFEENQRVNTYHIYEWTDSGFSRVFDTSQMIRRIWWSDDSIYLAAQTADGITLFDTVTQNRIAEYPHAVDLKFSEDSQHLAVAYPSHVDFWDLATQTIQQTITDETAGISQIAWSRNGNYLAATSKNHIYVWFVDTGALLNTFYEEVVDTFTCEIEPCRIIPIVINEILWAKDNQHLAFSNTNFNGSAYRGTNFDVWHVPSNRIVYTGGIGSFAQFEWSPHKDYIFTRSSAGNGYPRSHVINMVDFAEPVNSDVGELWAFNPNGETALTATHSSNKISLHTLDNLGDVHEFDTKAHRPRDLAWHSNGQLFASVHRDEVQVWDVVTGKRIARQLEYMTNYASVLGWGSDNLSISYISESLSPLHSHTSVNTRRMYLDETPPIPVETISFAELDSNGVKLVSDKIENRLTGNTVVVVNDGNTKFVLIYDAHDNLLHELNYTQFDYVKWQPQSPFLMLANNDQLALYDVNAGNIISEIELMPSKYNVVISWHPQGGFVAILGEELTIWQISADGVAWTQVQTISTINYPRFAWHPTEPWLVIGDGTVLHVVNILTAETLAITVIPSGSSREVTSLAWNPDGTRLAFTIWLDTFIYIWEID